MGSVLSKHEKHVPVDPLLLEVSDVMATSLDLDTTLRRVAEVVRKVIDYEIFAILLLNEKTQELRFRFQVGYPPEFAERARIKVGVGVTGLAAQLRQTILINDVTQDPRYVSAVPNVRSELAVPLTIKNRVIGVIDLEARDPGYFTEEHSRLLSLIASRMAAGIENAQLYTRTTKQARILVLLNEIARELTSILNLDELLGRIAELLRRLIDFQMFSILLLDSSGENLQHRFSLRFNENVHVKHGDSAGPRLGRAGGADEAGDRSARREQRSPLHREQSGNAVGIGRAPGLQRQGNRRARSGAHAARIFYRRPPPHHDDAGRAGGDCHRERPPL